MFQHFYLQEECIRCVPASHMELMTKRWMNVLLLTGLNALARRPSITTFCISGPTISPFILPRNCPAYLSYATATIGPIEGHTPPPALCRTSVSDRMCSTLATNVISCRLMRLCSTPPPHQFALNVPPPPTGDRILSSRLDGRALTSRLPGCQNSPCGSLLTVTDDDRPSAVQEKEKHVIPFRIGEPAPSFSHVKRQDHTRPFR